MSTTSQPPAPSKWAMEAARKIHPTRSSGHERVLSSAAIIQRHHAAAQAETVALRTLVAKWKDCAEYGWTIIANASGGNWKEESTDWQTAAAKFRDENYYPCLRLTPATIADELAALKSDCDMFKKQRDENERLLLVSLGQYADKHDELAAKDAKIVALKEAAKHRDETAQFIGKENADLRTQLTTAHAHMDKLREHRNELDAACHELEGKLRESEAARGEAEKDSARIESLARCWDSLGRGHHLMGAWIPNTTGSFRDAVDTWSAARAQEARP